MNIVITTEHRVGSRWLHYLLADLYNMQVSPELDGSKVADTEEIRKRFAENRIVKFHHLSPQTLFERLTPVDYKVIGMVRNPRDRGVSLCFHNRYHKKGVFDEQSFETDREALRWTILESPFNKKENEDQLKLMWAGHSTRSFKNSSNYLWTTYEWMKENPIGELRNIINFLGQKPDKHIDQAVKRNSFKNKSNRKPGEENKKDLWRRKGIIGDWENWFDDEMIGATEIQFQLYYILKKKG